MENNFAENKTAIKLKKVDSRSDKYKIQTLKF